MITVTGPTGSFVLHEGSPDPAVFIALDDGIAPIKSILEHAVSIDMIEAFHLYWANRGADGHHLAKWCRAMTESLDNFRYTHFTGTPPGASGAAKVLDALAADYPDPRRIRFYVAGPAHELELLTEGLVALGVDRGLIACEAAD
jgi:CDP-4-dehydro-6-deoxyglucose reductase